MDTSCLKTVLVNTSGKRMRFPFIGAHGGILDNGQEYTADGDLYSVVMGPEIGVQHRRLASFISAVANGLIQVKSSPSPFFFDSTAQATKVIKVNNNTVSAAAPCYENP